MNYWLSPQGQVWESEEIGCHYKLAESILQEKFPSEFDEYGYHISHNHEYVEMLEEKGYVRYCDWGTDPSWAIPFSKRLTNRQLKKMFDLTGYIHK